MMRRLTPCLAALVCGGALAAQIAPPPGFRVETVVGGLDLACAMAFAPDGRLFVVERLRGAVRSVRDGVLSPDWITVPTVGTAAAEAGLLGIAIDPAFPTQPYVYLYSTRTVATAPGWEVVILRVEERGGVGVNPTVIGPAIPATGRHVGGPLVFGRDGRLYAAVGDGAVDPIAQSLGAPHGKILRLVTPAGTVPPDNPFVGVLGAVEEIWSYGHRNPFGLSVHPFTGDLYETENSSAGGDELNRIRRGANYGWPIYDGPEPAPDPATEDPLATFRPDPALVGAAFVRGELWPAAWRGRWFVAGHTVGHLRAMDVDPATGAVSNISMFEQDGTKYGVLAAPDGNLWALVGPRPARGADRIVRYVHDQAPDPGLEVMAVSNVALGGNLTLGVTGANGDTVVAWLGFARLPSPIPTPFGTLFVPADLSLPSFPIVGDARGYLRLPLVDDPNLRGASLHFQAATVRSATARLTNAVEYRLH